MRISELLDEPASKTIEHHKGGVFENTAPSFTLKFRGIRIGVITGQPNDTEESILANIKSGDHLFVNEDPDVDPFTRNSRATVKFFVTYDGQNVGSFRMKSHVTDEMVRRAFWSLNGVELSRARVRKTPNV